MIAEKGIDPQAGCIERHILFAGQRQQQKNPIGRSGTSAQLPDAPQQKNSPEYFGMEVIENGGCHLPVIQEEPGGGNADQRRKPVLASNPV